MEQAPSAPKDAKAAEEPPQSSNTSSNTSSKTRQELLAKSKEDTPPAPKKMGPLKRMMGKMMLSMREEVPTISKPSLEMTNATRHRELQLNLTRLKDLRLEDVAIPKADIVALPLDASMESFFDALREHGYSRIPVFTDTLDDPKGLVHVKDIFMTFGLDGEAKNFSLEPFMRPLIYVPPSMRLVTLLQKMQSDHIHMALVIDEYGGVDGLITIEDILEQIVGEITDEHDEADEILWHMEKPGVYLANARAGLEEFTTDTGITLPIPEGEDDLDTLGGLVTTLVSRVPAKGEVVKSDDGIEFEIIEADPRRIKTIRIRVPVLQSEAFV